MRNPYEVLEIGRYAKPDEVKSAYRKKVRKTHPDHRGTTQEFHEVKQAYELLSDAARRKQFDQLFEKWLRRNNAHACAFCGTANQIDGEIPEGLIAKCGRCKQPLNITRESHKVGHDAMLRARLDDVIDSIGGEVIALAGDAIKVGIQKVRSKLVGER